VFEKFPYRFKSYTLRVVDFPGNIEPCFLTNRSLYVLTWDPRENPDVIKERLSCLVSYVSNSLVMIVATFKENKMEKLIRSYPAFDKLQFGTWLSPEERKNGKMGNHWFSFVDIQKPKGKISAKESFLLTKLFRFVLSVDISRYKCFWRGIYHGIYLY